MEVHLFIPCFVDQLYPQTGFNMVKVLEKAGCQVVYNPQQTCCGQPAFNAGFWGEAKEVCTKFVKDFEQARYIVAPSASCVGFIRNYYKTIFDNSAYSSPAKKISEKTFEFSDFLVNVLGQDDFGASFPHMVTYHDSCAALRECKIKTEPRRLLSKVRGLTLIEMAENETCCGFGGTFAVKFEPISVAMAQQKINHAEATPADYMVSTDLSCLMHIEGCARHRDSSIQTIHLADVLASGW
ncbi:MAG: (Fe-S)-binding protein [Sphingobacteriia bacterium]|nr:MAG: (Fe-S)-binding protein [Sphingobacteriia bacterium]